MLELPPYEGFLAEFLVMLSQGTESAASDFETHCTNLITSFFILFHNKSKNLETNALFSYSSAVDVLS